MMQKTFMMHSSAHILHLHFHEHEHEYNFVISLIVFFYNGSNKIMY